jgi:hypothetical protein
LACSDSPKKTTQSPGQSGSHFQKTVGNPQTPFATHMVYSPLVGSGGTPAVVPTQRLLEISVNPETIKVGEKVTITVQPGDIDTPICYLYVRDSGSEDVAYTVAVSSNAEVFTGEGTSQMLELVSTKWKNGQAVFTLQGIHEGQSEMWATVIPEVWATTVPEDFADGGGSKLWVSQRIQITVGK